MANSNDKAAQSLLAKMFKEEPVKIVQFCLTLIARDLVAANATDAEFSQEMTVGDKRYKVKITSQIEQINQHGKQ